MRRLLGLAEVLTIERLLLLILFSSASLGISGYSSDLFLHLAAGKYLVTTGALPDGDPFSFTRAGAPWVMHEWLYQLVLYLLHEWTGLLGLKLFGAAMLVAIIYFTRKSGELAGASPLVAWGVTLASLLTWHQFISLRPHIVTYLCFVFYLYAVLRYRYRHDRRVLLLLPFLMLVWVNSHGGFILGLVLLGYVLVVQLLERRIRLGQWRLDKPLVATLMLALGASLANPYGYEQWLFPLQLMNQWAMSYVTEWQPPDVTEWSNMLYLLLVTGCLVSTLLWATAERWYRLALMLPFIAASLSALRHLPLATFVVAPFLASQLERGVSVWKARHSAGANAAALGRREYLFNWVVLACYGIAMVVSYPLLAARSAADAKRHFPIGAARYLMEHAVRGRMFAPIEYSSYILFYRYPEQQVFYDVRIDMYGAELAQHYMTMVNAVEGWQTLFAQYAIDYAVLDKTQPIYNAIVNDDRFTLLYDDETSAVFRYSPRPNPQRPAMLQAG